MGDARKTALTVLEKCRRAGAWSDAALGSAMDAAGLDGRDRALAAALCYGTQQNRLLLDHVIGQYSDRKMGKLEPKVADILRLSAYQLLFTDKIPPAAAVSEGVRLCRELGYARACGFVNAVLRKIAAKPELPEIDGTAAQRLSIRYSHPLWLTDYLLNSLGETETEAFLRLDNTPAPVTVQVNRLKTDAETLLKTLEGKVPPVRLHPVLPDCLVMDSAGELAKTQAFQNGWFYVQDAAAKFSVLAAEPRAGQRILDVCAAPGGKSFAAAMLSDGQAEITACDLHPNKLRRLRDGADRLGLQNCITTETRDGRQFCPEWENRFDTVLVDAPCSGLGVIRKKPDIREKDPADFVGLPEIQLAILSNSARYLKPGGTLLYSTCTVRTEENETVVKRFLDENREYHPAEFSSPWGEDSRDGMLRLWPQRHGTDGFFIAKLRKQRD